MLIFVGLWSLLVYAPWRIGCGSPVGLAGPDGCAGFCWRLGGACRNAGIAGLVCACSSAAARAMAESLRALQPGLTMAGAGMLWWAGLASTRALPWPPMGARAWRCDAPGGSGGCLVVMLGEWVVRGRHLLGFGAGLVAAGGHHARCGLCDTALGGGDWPGCGPCVTGAPRDSAPLRAPMTR